ncbi:hypothetical protein U27_03897 [Candidatus Vecturithrix granuli]|uniref:DUF5655 domain-containing protein n=1 Tax=Vecturithrix granuli TaxID=1499967 RepID=A0A081BX78_VECG1|nr:hypothetical protein U27_03897 [Candidatus Vecturithrix granuli]
MYKSKIFLVGDDKDRLIALEEAEYMTEDMLQGFLEKYPDLLPGDQIAPENPRRWVLVAREMGIPGDEHETGRWSLDHLFLDQDGIPTFVECKRSSDTRIRREVVAQMLDYAANGIEYWSMERIRQAATETAQAQGDVLDEKISALLGDNIADTDVEQYWKTVETNLREHKVRLVFVADSTSKELRRLIEFLNEEMTHVEVLAVEIKQFQREDRHGQKALVPRVIGLTESARNLKDIASPQTQHTTREAFLEACLPDIRDFFQNVLDAAQENDYTVYWGLIGFSIRTYSPKRNKVASFVYGYPPNKFQVYLHPDWMDDKKAGELREALRKFQVFEEGGNYTLTTFVTPDNMAQLQTIYHFIVEQVKEHIQAHNRDRQHNSDMNG